MQNPTSVAPSAPSHAAVNTLEASRRRLAFERRQQRATYFITRSRQSRRSIWGEKRSQKPAQRFNVDDRPTNERVIANHRPNRTNRLKDTRVVRIVRWNHEQN